MARARLLPPPRAQLVTAGTTTRRRDRTAAWLERAGVRIVPVDAAGSAEVDIVVVHCAADVSAAATVAASRGRTPVPHLVLGSGAPQPAELMGAISSGAQGWVSDEVSDDALVRAIDDVIGGSVALGRSHVGLVVAQLRRRSERTVTRPNGRAVQLSTREWDVLSGLSGGATGAEVAAMLGIDQATVRGYVASAVRRLKVTDRAQAVRLFRGDELAQAVT